MKLQITSDREVLHYQNIEKTLFELDNFSVGKAVFPKNLFRVKFDKYYLIETIDWFNSKEDYVRFISFIKLSKSNSFFASCPPFYMINAIKVSVNDTYQTYIANHSYANIDHRFKGVGIRKSPETFFYNDSKDWAIVCDITSNITIIGLKNITVSSFEKAFKGHYNTIGSFLKNNSLPDHLIKEVQSNYTADQ